MAVEEPLEIRLDGEPVAVLMRTPGADEELALGFLRTETILRDRSQVSEVVHVEDGDRDAADGGAAAGRESVAGNVVDVRTREAVALEGWQRRMLAGASCGLCGKTTIDAVRLEIPAAGEAAGIRPSVSMLATLPPQLDALQPGFRACGGLHAAALFDALGALVHAREDIGRHNAVDKVIGRVFADGAPDLANTLLLVSGRASFEIVQKALVVGIRAIAAVSAPSNLAVDLAREADALLVAFLREGRFNVYAGAERISGGRGPA